MSAVTTFIFEIYDYMEKPIQKCFLIQVGFKYLPIICLLTFDFAIFIKASQ